MNIGGLALLPHRICRGCGSQRASAMTSQVVIGEKWFGDRDAGFEPSVLTDRGPESCSENTLSGAVLDFLPTHHQFVAGGAQCRGIGGDQPV